MPHMHTCMTQQLQYIHGYSTALNAPLVHELDNWSIQYLQWAWLCAVEVAHGMSRCLDAKGGRFVHIFDYNNENLYPTIDYRAAYVVSIIYDPTMMSRSPHTAIFVLTDKQPTRHTELIASSAHVRVTRLDCTDDHTKMKHSCAKLSAHCTSCCKHKSRQQQLVLL